MMVNGSMSGVARDVTADRLIEERVAFMAHYDNLTGLANRYLFNERLRSLTGEQHSKGSNIALFYLDLDAHHGDDLVRHVHSQGIEEGARQAQGVAQKIPGEFTHPPPRPRLRELAHRVQPRVQVLRIPAE